MNCEHVRRLLDAHVDGELDASTDGQVAQHLAACPGCTALSRERRALGERLRLIPRHPAPLSLHRSIAATLDHPVRAGGRAAWRKAWHEPTLRRRALMTGAALAAAFATGLWTGRRPVDDDLAAEFADRHAHSLGPEGPRIAIASSDRHVVKPWFAGRIDFSPPVWLPDPALPDRTLPGQTMPDQKYKLLGARIDEIRGRRIAAIVYQVRLHYISLFAGRTTLPGARAPHTRRLHGYTLVSWAADGLAMTAVSDIGTEELEHFARAVIALG